MKEMKNYNDSISLKGIFKSFKNAFNGVRVLLRHEHNLYIQILAAIFITAVGFYFELTALEWMIQTMTVSLVIFSELINTSIEKIMDLVHPDYDKRVKDIKDMAAGAVLFTVSIALAVALIMYVPKIFV